jgi:uncharacterized protein (TIGR02996 family)
MNEESAFLAAIQAAPQDDAVRLVYADWLEERDDPRGEFIRLQAEMLALPAYSDRYVRLKARREELRPRIEAAWLRTMGYVPRHRPLFHRLPAGRAERWRLVEEFIEVWYRPLRAGDGYSEAELAGAEGRLGRKLPVALREWYALAGKRADVWSKLDGLLPPEKVNFHESRLLLVHRDCLAWELWGIRPEELGEVDPPIFEAYSGAQSSPTTTAFAIQAMLLEALSAKGVLRLSGGRLPEEALRKAPGDRLSKCELPGRYRSDPQYYFYEGVGLVLVTDGVQGANVAARGEEALGQLGEELLERLDRHN